MNEQDKKRFVDQLQKIIARQCQSTCKSIKNQQCFNQCYNKHVLVVQTINQTIKYQAYKKHSMIGYKAYPQPQIQMMHYYNENIFPNVGSVAFAQKWDSAL